MVIHTAMPVLPEGTRQQDYQFYTDPYKVDARFWLDFMTVLEHTGHLVSYAEKFYAGQMAFWYDIRTGSILTASAITEGNWPPMGFGFKGPRVYDSSAAQ